MQEKVYLGQKYLFYVYKKSIIIMVYTGFTSKIAESKTLGFIQVFGLLQ